MGIFGLVKHEATDELPDLKPEYVSFTPGDNVTFFIVRCTKEEVFGISETPADKHLRAYFGVVKEPVGPSMNRFYVVPESRNRGIATLLVHRALQGATAQGGQESDLNALANIRSAKRRYEKMGFSVFRCEMRMQLSNH